MKKITVIDKSSGLTNVLPPRVFYMYSSKIMKFEELIKYITVENKSTRTFDLHSLKPVLENFDRNPFTKKVKIVFLAKHVAGAEYALIEVELTKLKKVSKCIINGVQYSDFTLPEGNMIALAFD